MEKGVQEQLSFFLLLFLALKEVPGDIQRQPLIFLSYPPKVILVVAYMVSKGATAATARPFMFIPVAQPTSVTFYRLSLWGLLLLLLRSNGGSGLGAPFEAKEEKAAVGLARRRRRGGVPGRRGRRGRFVDSPLGFATSSPILCTFPA